MLFETIAPLSRLSIRGVESSESNQASRIKRVESSSLDLGQKNKTNGLFFYLVRPQRLIALFAKLGVCYSMLMH